MAGMPLAAVDADVDVSAAGTTAAEGWFAGVTVVSSDTSLAFTLLSMSKVSWNAVTSSGDGCGSVGFN